MANGYVRPGSRRVEYRYETTHWAGLTVIHRGRVTFTMNTRLIKQAFQTRAREAAIEMGEIALKQARQNVAPGVGPGPHPHISRHVDTGELMRRIFRRLVHEGQSYFSEIVCPAEVFYGMLLEKGWHTSTGRFVRYPWLWPAFEASKSRQRWVLWKTMERAIPSTYTPSRGPVEVF